MPLIRLLADANAVTASNAPTGSNAPIDWWDYLPIGVAVAIVLVGLLGFGLSDVARFRFRRLWAISGVCFDESIRRRVLWIIPVAILGLIAVVQLQQPVDAQDAIRQTTKFCLLTTGLVVVTSTIILAATNLPREIENRVIFTIVTKPTTRLEIVLGKIVGFARVSATILVIMGLFTYGYLRVRAWNLQRGIESQLTAGTVDPISRPTFRHYVEAGLLNAKTLVQPVAMNVYDQEIDAVRHRRYPTPEGYLLVPFKLPPNPVASVDPEGTQFKMPGMQIKLRLGYDPTAPPSVPTGGKRVPATHPAGPTRVQVAIFDQNGNALLSPAEVGDPQGVAIAAEDASAEATVNVLPSYTAKLDNGQYFYVAISAVGGEAPYWVPDPAKSAVSLVVPTVAGGKMIVPTTVQFDDAPGRLPVVFTAREGTFGQVIKGEANGKSQVCVLSFRDVDVRPTAGGRVPIELRAGIEKAGESADQDKLTDVSLQVVNLTTNTASPAVTLQPENNRTLFADVPASAVTGGNFDVVLECKSNDQWVAFRQASLSVVRDETYFALNLTKSLLVLWLMSVLVTTIAVFASTFLSWPIAVVLTCMVLFGRAAVDELGDAVQPGVGRATVTEFKIDNPAMTQVVSNSVEQLNRVLKWVTYVLPDVSKFSATEDIERGMSMPWRTMWGATGVLAGFGLPLSVVAYVILKNKEVAP